MRQAKWWMLAVLAILLSVYTKVSAQDAVQEDSLHWTWYMSSVDVVPGDTGYVDVIFAVKANSQDDVAKLAYQRIFGEMSTDLYDFGEAEGKDPQIVEAYPPNQSGDEYEELTNPDGPNNWELMGWAMGPEVTVSGIDVAKARYFIKNPDGTSNIRFTSAGTNFAYTETGSVYVSISFDNSGGDVPLPVILSSIRAGLVRTGVAEISWAAEVEPGTVGFRVWRRCGSEPYVRVSHVLRPADATLKRQKYTFVDKSLCDREPVLYKIEELRATGSSVFYGPVVLSRPDAFPTKTALQVFPNPASAEVGFRIRVDQAEPVVMAVYDVTGRQVWHKRITFHEPGQATVRWNAVGQAGLRVSNGIYLVTARAGEKFLVRRCVILR